MVGLTNASGRSLSRRVDSLTDRTWFGSGGSLGGNKKAGTVHVGPSWGVLTSKGNYLKRAPNGCCDNSVSFFMRHTTLNPTQQYGYRATRTGRL